MATLKLTKSTTVSDLRIQFNGEFGSQVKVYIGARKAEDSNTLGECGLSSNGEFECRGSLTVASFIERMHSEFGLKVKVYTCDEWVAVLGGLTLESSGKVKKNAVKADMESMIAYQKDSSALNESSNVADGNDELSNNAEAVAQKEKSDKGSSKFVDPFEKLMIDVPAGSFIQYDRSSDWNNPRTMRRMTISKDFKMCKYSVTQGQWKAVMGSNPSYWPGDDNLPVENVSWNDVQNFIEKLNKMTGKKYRLPTEAEWLWAAMGANINNNQRKWAGCDSEEELGDYAWYEGNHNTDNDIWTHIVGQKKPNELGIYDMTGNVCEWCQDWYQVSRWHTGDVVDYSGPDTGTQRIHLGAFWGASSDRCSIFCSGMAEPERKGNIYGFRLCL